MTIGPIAHGGHWVARHEGRVVFVRHTLAGEVVRATVTKGDSSSRFLFADAVEVLKTSPHRIRPACPYAGPGGCGGCDFQHVELGEQRRLKASVLVEAMARFAGLDLEVEVESLPGDEDGLRWRSRLRLAVDRDGRAGFRPFHSHGVLPVTDCLLATHEVGDSGVFERTYPGANRVEVTASNRGDVLVSVQPHGSSRATPGADQISCGERVTVAGHDWDFEVAPGAFWQAHVGAASALVEAVLGQLDLRPGERVIDLYAGVGLFAQPMADRVGPSGRVTAIESDLRAVTSCNAWAKSRPEVEIKHDRVERALTGLNDGHPSDAVVLDPPRSGAGRQVVEAIANLGPRRICYVACDPVALARDTAHLLAHGYRLEQLRAFDAFPMTHHLETVALFTSSASTPVTAAPHRQ